ncbi:MAG TPA: outer membrane beta-barrel protein, partial [Nitrosopumilaceae archaeon]|nr:outer membrane beta-barrel protein [Nitrosopumilaceae archaeon]
MKKNLRFSIIMMGVLSLLFMKEAIAQQTEKRFKAGMSLGGVISDVNGADARDGDNDFRKIGYTGGLFVNTALNPKNILQFEINYITKGSMTPPDSFNNGYFKIILSYVEVPIIVKHHIKFNVKKKPMEKFDLEGGLSVGRLVNHDVIGAANYSIADFTNAFNTTDVSLVGGIDYNFSKNVYLCIR